MTVKAEVTSSSFGSFNIKWVDHEPEIEFTSEEQKWIKDIVELIHDIYDPNEAEEFLTACYKGTEWEQTLGKYYKKRKQQRKTGTQFYLDNGGNAQNNKPIQGLQALSLAQAKAEAESQAAQAKSQQRQAEQRKSVEQSKALKNALERQKELEQESEKYLQDLLEEFATGRVHPQAKEVLRNIEVGNLVFLVGPAGSGKTTLAMQVADALGKDFHFTGAVHQKHELLGFIDANGNYIRTPFREAFEHGGVFLFDEYDASAPNTLTAFNAALSNGTCAFPDGIVRAHEDFVAIAAGNTYGAGATRQYVGRFQQDAAALDRFVFIEITYDEKLETDLAIQNYTKHGGWSQDILDNYLYTVRDLRRVINDLELQHIVSPRASIMGARLLAKNTPLEVICEMTLYKGMSDTMRKQVHTYVKNGYKTDEELERADSRNF